MCHSSNASLESNETSTDHPSTMSFCHSSTDDLCDTSAVDLCYSPDISSPPTQRKKPKKISVSVSVRVKGKNKGKTLSYDNCIACNHCAYIFDRNTDYQHSKKCWHTIWLIRCSSAELIQIMPPTLWWWDNQHKGNFHQCQWHMEQPAFHQRHSSSKYPVTIWKSLDWWMPSSFWLTIHYKRQLLTDCHKQISKYMAEVQPGIEHRYDVWHISKSMHLFIYILQMTMSVSGKQVLRRS